jgi:hypothetical protein
MAMLDYALDYRFTMRASAAGAPQIVGSTAAGIRAVFPIGGGEIDGPALRGRILPGGADWLTLRSDGVALIDVRLVLESHDGALIDCRYEGIADFGEDAHARMLAGALPPQARIRVAPRFLTADPRYLGFNRTHALGIGEVDFERMRIAYDVYAVR